MYTRKCITNNHKQTINNNQNYKCMADKVNPTTGAFDNCCQC